MPVIYPSLSEKDRESFLARRHIAVLSMPNGEHAPISSPIWYGYEPGGDINIFIHETSLKARRMLEGVRVSFTVHTEDPLVWVSAEGPVVSIRKGDLDRDFRRLAQRYLDNPDEQRERVEAYRTAEDEMLWVTIRPERWRSSDLSGDPDF